MSDDRKDPSKYININRTFESDRKFSSLVESVRDDDHMVERSMVIPALERISARRRRNLAEKQNYLEKKAFDTFQHETSSRRPSEPLKPNKSRLRELSRAEEILRNEQKQAAESLRQSQKEISRFFDGNSVDPKDNSTTRLGKEEPGIIANYGYILHESGGVSGAKSQRESRIPMAGNPVGKTVTGRHKSTKRGSKIPVKTKSSTVSVVASKHSGVNASASMSPIIKHKVSVGDFSSRVPIKGDIRRPFTPATQAQLQKKTPQAKQLASSQRDIIISPRRVPSGIQPLAANSDQEKSKRQSPQSSGATPILLMQESLKTSQHPTPARRPLSVQLAKLTIDAKQNQNQKYMESYKKVVNERTENKEERKNQLQQVKEKFKKKSHRIINFENDNHQAELRYSVGVKENNNTIHGSAELQARLNDLRNNLASELKQLNETVNARPCEIRFPSHKQLAQARKSRLTRKEQQQRMVEKETEKVIQVQTEELAGKKGKSRVTSFPYRIPKARAAYQLSDVKAPATVSTHRKSILEMPNTPSVMMKSMISKRLNRENEIAPKIPKFLKEKKAVVIPMKLTKSSIRKRRETAEQPSRKLAVMQPPRKDATLKLPAPKSCASDLLTLTPTVPTILQPIGSPMEISQLPSLLNSPLGRPPGPSRRLRVKASSQNKSFHRPAFPPIMPRSQVKQSTMPLRSFKIASRVEPEAQFVVLKQCHLRGRSLNEAQENSLAAAAKTWKMPQSTCQIVRRKKLFERSLNDMSKKGASNKELLKVFEGVETIEIPMSRTKIHSIAKHIGLDPEQQVEKIFNKATKMSNDIQEALASVSTTVLESIQQRDHSSVSPLAAEEADGIFKMIMDESEGVCLKGAPGEIVPLVFPSEGPTLALAGNAVESPSKGVIAEQVPVREINALSNRKAEEFASAVKQQPSHKFPVESIAAQRLPDKPIEVPPASEPRPKEDYIQHDLLFHSFQVENFFQARGSAFPKWFPGIYTVFPNKNLQLVMKKSPSEVLLKAWQIMKPKNMD